MSANDIPIDDNIVIRGDDRYLPESVEPSGSGHTIIDGSGTSMTQRTGLQFEGAEVTDDSTNDRTKVSINAYAPGDSAETTIDDADYFPFYDTSASAKKKTLWSTIIDKIKSALGIASSGDTFLKKDGTWATPTNTTYTFATGDNNGQIKVTPSGGSAQNIDVKGLGDRAYDSTTYLPLAGGTVTGTLILSRTQDASGTANNKPALIVGGTDTAAHLELDGNELMAKSNGTTTGDLLLNHDGGAVKINGKIATKLSATPTSGQVMIADGTDGDIKTSGYTISKSVPSSAVFTDTTYGAARGLALSNANNFYIRNWLTMTATAVNAGANVTLRYMSGIALAYQIYFVVNKSTATSAQDFTVDGTSYRYAPLFSLTASDASNLVSNTDNLPADGEVISLFRHINAATGTNTVLIRLGKKSNTYYILDDSIRTTTKTTAGINAVISANTWHYKMPGVLFFLYNN